MKINTLGITISSQNLAYAISKFIGGILSDVVSCRILFGSGLFLSGILNLNLNRNLKVCIEFDLIDLEDNK